jgi:seryl-tRNA synthetase
MMPPFGAGADALHLRRGIVAYPRRKHRGTIMHDIRAIRENPDAFDAALARRGLAPMASELLAMDAERRARITAAETAQAEQNRASKEVGAAKGRGDEAEFARLRALVAEKKAEVARLHEEAGTEQARLSEMLAGIPNLPLEDVPSGRTKVTMWNSAAGARRAIFPSHRKSISISRARRPGFDMAGCGETFRIALHGAEAARWRVCTGRWRSS